MALGSIPKYHNNRHYSFLFFLSLIIFTLLHIFAIVHNLSKSTFFESSSSTSFIEDISYDNNENNIELIDRRNNNDIKNGKDNSRDNFNATIPWKAKIAYVVSLTSCTSQKYDQKFIDGAAVLKHSIHLSSIHNSKKSKYSYHMIAIVHPQAVDCSQNFTKLGYEVLIRDTPINVTQIKGDFLRERIVKTGCCQEKELIKLWSYTLTNYPIVVHLDIDTLVLQPMDELFDVMIDGPTEKSMHNIPIMKHPNVTTLTAKVPKAIDVFFTRDYNIAIPGKRHVGFQGGFFMIRPSQSAFNEYLKLLLEGDFQPYLGWAGIYGGYYGAMQIQGIMSYFYDHFHPHTAVELNRCIYNSMVDNPRARIGEHEGKCRVGGGNVCEDCRTKNIDDIKLIHFTECKKPWDCGMEDERADEQNERRLLCNDFHKSWFRVRRELEKSWNYPIHLHNRSNISKSNWIEYNYLGYCTMQGSKGYKPLRLPD